MALYDYQQSNLEASPEIEFDARVEAGELAGELELLGAGAVVAEAGGHEVARPETNWRAQKHRALCRTWIRVDE